MALIALRRRHGRWIAVLGVRHDDAKNQVAGQPDEESSATTKRAGLMVRLPGGFVPYVSYSESFTPVAGTNLFGARFKPLEGKQVETGVKWESADGRLAFNAAWYDLTEENQLVTDPGNPLNTVQTGETRAHGTELELVGRVLPNLDIAAQYTYTQVDPQLEQTPEHLFSIWGKSRFALTVQNIADREYVSPCLSRGDCFYGARRTAIVSAHYRF